MVETNGARDTIMDTRGHQQPNDLDVESICSEFATTLQCRRPLFFINEDAPFKIQVNVDILLFEGKIQIDALKRLLTSHRVVFLSLVSLIRRNLHSYFQKHAPVSGIGGRTIVNKPL
jgi:hypothetical protein